MGNKTGIKWNGVSESTQPTLDVIGANLQLIVRDPKTQQEWVTTSQDYANFLVDNGIISSGGWGLLGNAGTDPNVNFVGTTDNVGLILGTNGVPRIGFDATGGTISTSNIFAVSPERGEISWTVTEAALRIYVGGVIVSKIGVNTSGIYLGTATDVLFIDNVTSNVGIGTTTPVSLLTVDDGDIEVANKNKGLILSSPDGTRWRIAVSNLGVISASTV